MKYTFDWGDGSTPSQTGLVGSGVSASASHSWSSAGTYRVKAMATDSGGASSGWSNPLSVSITGSRCPTGQTDCDGVCVDTQTDTNNCGDCDVTCTVDASKHVTGVACSGGTCVITSCSAGWDDCDDDYSNGCEIQINDADVNNCGACGNYCPGGRTCDNGVCSQCPAGQTDCDGVCVDTQTDTNNCGDCDVTCTVDASKHVTGVACSGGTCVITSCSAGWDDCDDDYSNGCEIQINDADVNNCGACGNYCPGGRTCDNGVCSQCPAGQTDCDGVCVDTSTDINNCGDCGNYCPAGRTCDNGACSQCPAGQTEVCDGVCVDTQTNSSNCGGCGNICQYGYSCCNGQLSCPPGTLCVGNSCVCPYPCNGEPYCGMVCINGDCFCRDLDKLK